MASSFPVFFRCFASGPTKESPRIQPDCVLAAKDGTLKDGTLPGKHTHASFFPSMGVLSHASPRRGLGGVGRTVQRGGAETKCESEMNKFRK